MVNGSFVSANQLKFVLKTNAKKQFWKYEYVVVYACTVHRSSMKINLFMGKKEKLLQTPHLYKTNMNINTYPNIYIDYFVTIASHRYVPLIPMHIKSIVAETWCKRILLSIALMWSLHQTSQLAPGRRTIDRRRIILKYIRIFRIEG